MAGFVDRTSKKLSSAIRAAKEIVEFPRNVLKINKIISKPTYYPELERKTRSEMWWENFMWLVQKRELNKFYTSYGMDVKNFRNPDDFISHREFCLWRNKGNQSLKYSITGNYNYICLLRDKYLFSAFLGSAIGEKFVVPTKAMIADGKAFVSETGNWQEIESLLTDGSELVYKVVDGECADGVMLVSVSGDQVVADGQTYTKSAFADSIRNKKIIVQNVVKQHSALHAFKTKSVNTIRVVTIKGKSGSVDLFAAFLRLGASADSFVDNRAVGGLGVGIDLETGKLMQYGFPHDSFGVKMEEHPLSGTRFEGFQIPHWQEAKELVKNAHKQFYELQSIGWDVVITEDGPILLEGNDDWEIGGPQDTYGGLRKKWFELVNA